MMSAYNHRQPAALKEIPVKESLKEMDRIMKNFKTQVYLINGFLHPNVLPTYGVITTDIGFLKIVMAFAPYGTLRELLDADPTMPLLEDIQRDYNIIPNHTAVSSDTAVPWLCLPA